MKMRPFELHSEQKPAYAEMLDAVMSGGSSTDDVLKAVLISGKRDEALADGTDTLWLLDDEWKWLVARLGATQWNCQPDTRKAIAGFITYLRELKEADVQVGKKE